MSQPKQSFGDPKRARLAESERVEMPKNEKRVKVTLACEECKRRNYQTQKSKRNTPDRVEFKKFCRWCGSHTLHRETR